MEIRLRVSKNAGLILKQLGYVHRRKPNDFIKEDVNGRFHAKLRPNQISIHYDLDVDGNHVAGVPMPIRLGKEQSRVQKHINKQLLRK